MKYIDLDIYEKSCWSSVPEEMEKCEALFQQQYNEWIMYFKQISNRFSKRFVNEFSKYHFHDNSFIDFYIKSNTLIICLQDYYEKDKIHQLQFEGIKNLNINFDDFKCLSIDWILCEIISENDKTISFEILTSAGILYVQFHNLKYKMKKKSNLKTVV